MSKSKKIVFSYPKRKHIVAYNRDGKEFCIPVVIRYPEGDNFYISPINPSINGLALEFYFTPTFAHERNPSLYCFFTRKLPEHFLVPATFRSTRADDWTNTFHQPVSAGWLRAGRDRKLWLERDEEKPLELDTANVDETLVATATTFFEIYEEADELERQACLP